MNFKKINRNIKRIVIEIKNNQRFTIKKLKSGEIVLQKLLRIMIRDNLPILIYFKMK